MNKPLKTERVIALMAPDDLRRVDDWMFARRIRSRGEAIRQLVNLGLTVETPNTLAKDKSPEP